MTFECGIGDSNPGRLVGSQESCRSDQSRDGQITSGRRGSRTLKAHRSPDFESAAVANRLALPSISSTSTGGQESNLRSSLNRAPPVPAQAIHRYRIVESRQTVGVAGFEPALSCSRSRRITRLSHTPIESTSAQRESNPHFRHGKAVGCRYIMGTIADAELSKNREHRVGLEPTSPHYGCGVLAAGRPVLATRFEWDQRGSNPHRPG